MHNSILILSLVVAVGLAWSTIAAARKREASSSFPGPKGLPWVGTAFQLPYLGAVFKFRQWGQKYGPICETKILGQRVLLISSGKIAKKHFVGQSSIYSSRPDTPALHDAQSNSGTAEYLPLMAYNEDHHRHKRVGKALLGSAQGVNFHHHVEREALRLVRQLHSRGPQPHTAWTRMTEDFTSRVISWLAFGSPDHAERLHKYTWDLLIAVSPCGALPNLLPFLKPLPYWLSPWKWYEHRRHLEQQSWFTDLLEQTRDSMRRGSSTPPSFLRDYLEASNQEFKAAAKSTTKPPSYVSSASAATIYESDTDAARAVGMIATAAIFTVSTPLQSFIRVLAAFPEWQAAVQAEMDTQLLPLGRAPTVSDLPQLPTFRAVLRESVRWRSGIPTGIPHEAQADSEFAGVRIGVGTAIFALECAIERDPAVYARPDTFDPRRWLDPASPNYRAPLTSFPTITGGLPMFGWGKRFCMGHELAVRELHAAGLMLAWAFRTECARPAALEEDLVQGEERGGYQWPKSRMQSLIIMKPKKLELKFEIRSKEVERALEESSSFLSA